MAEENKPQAVTVAAACAAPVDYAKLACAAGEKKAKQNYVRMFLLAILGGAYIGVGALCSISFAKGLPNADVGMQRFVFGAVFPVGLILVVLTGAELVTGNFAVEFFAFLNKRITLLELLFAWFLVYFGNFLGSLGVAYFLGFLTNLYVSNPYLAAVQSMAEGKINQDFGALVCLGIGCNWLVSLGVVLAMGARDMMSKIAIIWFPIQTFVTIGFEHCVANMTLIPIGILYGANLTFGTFILKNLIPVTIGNIIGAALLVAILEWYVFGIDPNAWNFDLIGRGGEPKSVEEGSSVDRSQSRDDIEDEYAPAESADAIAAGGPMKFQKLQSSDELERARRNHKKKKSHKGKHTSSAEKPADGEEIELSDAA